MSYISKEKYSFFSGEDPPEDVDVLAGLADQAVDFITLYQLRGRDMAALPEAVQTDVSRAAALQVQYLGNQGGVASVNDNSAASVGLGKFNYSGSAADSGNSAAAWISPLLPDLLAFTCAYLRGL